MIILKNVYKHFGEKLALHGLTLDLADSGITCLLGTSGCGKSTALRVAAGLLPPDHGSANLVPGSCGVVFQDARLLPWLTAEENLALALSQTNKDAIARAFVDVGLVPEEVKGLYPRELSGGMAQRVSIARALLRTSSCLLLDEPFAALDAPSRSELQKMLIKLCIKREIPALFVTHDINEALKIGNRLLVMTGGKIALQLEKEAFQADAKAASKKILQILEKKSI